jgi:hypothetical protein
MSETYEYRALQDIPDFSNRHNRTVNYAQESVETVFEDSEAISLCRGIDQPHGARAIWVRHQQDKQEPNDVFLAHKYAMALRGIHGNSFLAEIINLPLADFQHDRFKKIYRLFDLQSNRSKKGITTINLITSSKEVIVMEYIKGESKVFLHRNGRRRFAQISKSGTLKHFDSSEINIPVISLLFDYGDNPKKAILRYGSETGLCVFCNKPLSATSSARFGYGPVCARQRGLPWRESSSGTRKSNNIPNQILSNDIPNQISSDKLLPKKNLKIVKIIKGKSRDE